MKKLWAYITGAFVFLLGGFLYQKAKRESAEALNDNNEDNKKVAELANEAHKNDRLLEIEEVARKKTQEKLKKDSNETLDNDNLVDFFKSRK